MASSYCNKCDSCVRSLECCRVNVFHSITYFVIRDLSSRSVAVGAFAKFVFIKFYFGINSAGF